MKAMMIQEPGPADTFTLKEVAKPALSPGHLLIEVQATSVNPIDTKVRGKHLPFSPPYPAILHVDFAGVVAEVPPGITQFQVGDAVYGIGGGIKGTVGGALGDYLLVDADLVAPMPSTLSFVEAATLPLVSITAWEALCDKLQVTSGSSLLVHGGLGGVGHIAAQLGHCLGATVHTTLSTDEGTTLSKKLGATHAINYTTTSVAEYVAQYTSGEGFDFVFDTVGGPNLQNSFEAAKYNGNIACIATGGEHDLTLMYTKGLSLHSVLMLIPLITGKGRRHYGEILSKVKELVEEGKVKPLVYDKVFNRDEVAQAHQLVESKQHKGKVAIRC